MAILTQSIIRSQIIAAAVEAAKSAITSSDWETYLKDQKEAAKQERLLLLNTWLEEAKKEAEAFVEEHYKAAEEAAEAEGIRLAEEQFCKENNLLSPEELAAKAALEEARQSVTSLLKKVAKLLAKESKYSSKKSLQVAKSLKNHADRLRHAVEANNGWETILPTVEGEYHKLSSIVEDNKTQEEARQKAHADAIKRKATLVKKQERTSAPPQPTKKAPKPEPLARPTKPVVAYEDPIDEGGLTLIGAELAAIADKLEGLV